MEISLPLETMTMADKLQVIEEVWDSLRQASETVPSPPWHDQVLREREQKVAEGAAEFIDWQDARQSIRNDND